MSSQRDQILGRVRDALAPLAQRAPMPAWDRELVRRRQAPGDGDLWGLFSKRFSAVNGTALSSAGDLALLLRRNSWLHGYCDPQVWPLFSGALGEPFTVETDQSREGSLRCDFGITRAFGAIAETGTLILTDSGTSSRLAALAPWVHVAVLDRRDILADIPAALVAHPADPNIIWVTGPSKTADVEGIMIEGVHGPGVQVAFLSPSQA